MRWSGCWLLVWAALGSASCVAQPQERPGASAGSSPIDTDLEPAVQQAAYVTGLTLDGLVRSYKFDFSLPIGSASASFFDDGRFSIRVSALVTNGRWHVSDELVRVETNDGKVFVFRFMTENSRYLMDIDNNSVRGSHLPATKTPLRTTR
jgi:hypothetical protein